MQDAIRDPQELVKHLDLPAEIAVSAAVGVRDFGLFVPREFLARMEPGNPRDPLLLQVLPRSEETLPIADFGTDPVSDSAAHEGHGLLRKYPGRALLVVHETCAAHCRYCFRRHFPYDLSGPTEWHDALQTVASDPSIEELILSGGDPLTLGDDRLSQLVQSAESIPTLRRLRIHTRLPILIPQRITTEFVDLLQRCRLPKFLVVHVNHAREIDDQVRDAIARIQRAGAMVLNQAVLLREINDSVQALRELCTELIRIGVVPYYLHQLDRVAGAGHFEVPVERGRQLIQELRDQLPGYAVPRYVADVPGQAAKVVLA